MLDAGYSMLVENQESRIENVISYWLLVISKPFTIYHLPFTKLRRCGWSKIAAEQSYHPARLK